MAIQLKYVRKSEKYKYVTLYEAKDKSPRWRAQIFGSGKIFDTEREAAICIDKKLIDKGKEPVNILIKKETAI